MGQLDTIKFITLSVWEAAALILATPILYLLARIIYNLYFHPLSGYPGPKLWAISRMPWNWVNLGGRLAWRIRELHEQYGPVVRIAPDELSYTTGTAWKKIYGQRNPEFMKCLDGRGIAPVSINGVRGLITEEQDKHTRLRRAIVPAFSDRALREQEVWLHRYCDQLMVVLKSRSAEGPVNMTEWFHLMNYDINSGLAFGEHSTALNDGHEPWLRIMATRSASIAWYQIAMQYGVFDYLSYFAPKKAVKARMDHIAHSRAKLQRRLDMKGDPKDFMSYILSNETEKLNNTELLVMSSAFLVAGGTTSSALTGSLFFLLRNPKTMEKLAQEIRGTFSSADQITAATTTELPYLRAVIEETLRLYSPVPCALPRYVHKDGDVIDGKWLPAGIAVGVHQLSANHSELNFHDAKGFHPERYLPLEPDSPFARDDKSAAQPFSFGARNCIGKSLAYAAMRIIMSKFLFHFDLALEDGLEDWYERQKSFVVWERLPLMVKLSPRL